MINQYLSRMLIILILLSVFSLTSCAPTIQLGYDSDVRISEPIPAKAQINVRFGDVHKIYDHSKEYIKATIIRDIEENLLALTEIRNSDSLIINVDISTLDYKAQPWGLLWGPLVYIGFPLGKLIGIAEVEFVMKSALYSERYHGVSRIEKWNGLYYGYKYGVQAKREDYNGGIVAIALKDAIEKIKNQVEKDAHKFLPERIEPRVPIEKTPIVSTEFRSVDIDVDIPIAKSKNRDAVAVVIGNGNYSKYNSDIMDVEFAIYDAEIVKDYLINTLGYMEGNILFYKDATVGVFREVFGT